MCKHDNVYVASTIRFANVTYHVTENHGLLQPTLLLNSPSSINFTVQITDANITATGMLTIIIMTSLKHLLIIFRWRC